MKTFAIVKDVQFVPFMTIPYKLLIRVLAFHFSAGGTGVLLNLDHVADNLADWVPGIEVRGVSDSGWFLDNKQYKPAPCMNAHSCAPVDGIKRGVE